MNDFPWIVQFIFGMFIGAYLALFAMVLIGFLIWLHWIHTKGDKK